jgi:hypothetical protein
MVGEGDSFSNIQDDDLKDLNVMSVDRHDLVKPKSFFKKTTTPDTSNKMIKPFLKSNSGLDVSKAANEQDFFEVSIKPKGDMHKKSNISYTDAINEESIMKENDDFSRRAIDITEHFTLEKKSNTKNKDNRVQEMSSKIKGQMISNAVTYDSTRESSLKKTPADEETE